MSTEIIQGMMYGQAKRTGKDWVNEVECRKMGNYPLGKRKWDNFFKSRKVEMHWWLERFGCSFTQIVAVSMYQQVVKKGNSTLVFIAREFD